MINVTIESSDMLDTCTIAGTSRSDCTGLCYSFTQSGPPPLLTVSFAVGQSFVIRSGERVGGW